MKPVPLPDEVVERFRKLQGAPRTDMPEPTAVCRHVGSRGRPSSRMVLLKAFDDGLRVLRTSSERAASTGEPRGADVLLPALSEQVQVGDVERVTTPSPRVLGRSPREPPGRVGVRSRRAAEPVDAPAALPGRSALAPATSAPAALVGRARASGSRGFWRSGLPLHDRDAWTLEDGRGSIGVCP